MGYFAYEEFHEGDYPLGVCFVAAIVGNLWQWRRQKVRYQKVFEFLRQLKLKYGPEIYLEIEKEPSSFYYNAFQKLHPPDSWRVSIKLP
jgi:Zn-dependent protease with chaperone function